MTAATLLHRQINSAWLQQDRVTSQAFKPSSKDSGRLSVYDGDQLSAEKAWLHFTATLGLDSVGVLSVTFNECSQLDLPVHPDTVRFPEHAVIRFDGVTSNSQVEKKAKRLSLFAAARGWQFRAQMEA